MQPHPSMPLTPGSGPLSSKVLQNQLEHQQHHKQKKQQSKESQAKANIPTLANAPPPPAPGKITEGDN